MAPRGVPQIEVTFDIDANGILNVNAKDVATGKDQKIAITSSRDLSKEEVERMAKEAEAHAAEDKPKREEMETRNQLDAMVYSIEKMLKENGDKISGGERGEVENALADAKKSLEGTDTGRCTPRATSCRRRRTSWRKPCTSRRRLLRAARLRAVNQPPVGLSLSRRRTKA